MAHTYAERFSDALVSEIKAEMGRRDLSSRALGRLIGKSSQYMSDRLDGGSAKTGRRVVLTVRDLAAIGEALSIRPSELTARAHAAAIHAEVIRRAEDRFRSEESSTTDQIAAARARKTGIGVASTADDELKAVARPTDPEPDEEPS